MLELANNFIGKECLVYTFNGSELEGTVQEVVGNALLMVVKSELQAINLDFVVRIREYPRKKSGKKKSIVID